MKESGTGDGIFRYVLESASDAGSKNAIKFPEKSLTITFEPTPCTQPLAITTDSNGNVWFAQVNTGKVAKFVPITESFTEYDNPQWPLGARSMIWGIDYSPDNSIWFTDEAHNTVWKFSIDDETYTPNGFPEAMSGPCSSGIIPGIPMATAEVSIIPPRKRNIMIPFVFFFTNAKLDSLVISYSNKIITISTRQLFYQLILLVQVQLKYK